MDLVFKSLGKIFAQPHTLIMYTFCDLNAIHVRQFWKEVSLTVVHVSVMHGAVRKSFPLFVYDSAAI